MSINFALGHHSYADLTFSAQREKLGLKYNRSFHNANMTPFATIKPHIDQYFKDVEILQRDNGDILFSATLDGLPVIIRWQNSHNLQVATQQGELPAGFVELLKPLAVRKKPPRHTANVIVQARDGSLSLAGLSSPDRSFAASNYQDSDKIQQTIDLLLKERTATTPKGRIVIFSGPPGTGKTSLVSSLIDSTKWLPVVVAPHQVELLQDPGFTNLLIDFKADEDDIRPYLLIVEDADSCLEKRNTSNVGKVQALLNLTDGIMSSALNIFIVCTTNLPHLNIDSALTRPGRLLSQLDINKLSPEKATALSAELGFNQKYDEPQTLAEVYSNNSVITNIVEDAIITKPGESLIETVNTARAAAKCSG
jgi:ATPase family associated with various cellular activities (AAA)